MIQGHLFAHNSSAQQQAFLIITASRYKVQVTNTVDENTTVVYEGDVAELDISDRIGSTPRVIYCKDENSQNLWMFSTTDNDEVDAAIQNNVSLQTSTRFWQTLLHRLENNMKSVIATLAVTVFCILMFVTYGLPMISHGIASVLPQSIADNMGQQTLELLDEIQFETSELSDEQQQSIQDYFQKVLLPLELNQKTPPKYTVKYRLHFRKMQRDNQDIANAFALPSGDIVVTDGLVQLSENNIEVGSVLLHEIGHVVHRHSLEQVTQSSITSMLMILVLGNPDASGELVTGLGSALLAGHYSREDETQADTYALNKMLQANINPKAFATMMLSLGESSHESKPVTKKNMKADIETDEPSQTHTLFDHMVDYVSELGQKSIDLIFDTHPKTQARIDMAERFAQCFEQGKKICPEAVQQ